MIDYFIDLMQQPVHVGHLIIFYLLLWFNGVVWMLIKSLIKQIKDFKND